MSVTPFFTNYGLHLRFNISLPSDSINRSAEARVCLLEDVHRDFSLELTLASERYKMQPIRLRLDSPWFEVGDFVWLLRRNISTTLPCPKLDYKKLGPFGVIGKIGPMTIHVKLPSRFRIHNVFHVSFLEPHHLSNIPDRHPSAPPPIQLSTDK
jgi:hypothetical protein